MAPVDFGLSENATLLDLPDRPTLDASYRAHLQAEGAATASLHAAATSDHTDTTTPEDHSHMLGAKDFGVGPVVDRRSKPDRRGQDRRRATFPVKIERRKGNQRRVQRRRQIDPTTCERDYTDEEIEFMKAMDRYKRDSGRPFPTWSEVLEVLRALGYTRPSNPQQ